MKLCIMGGGLAKSMPTLFFQDNLLFRIMPHWEDVLIG